MNPNWTIFVGNDRHRAFNLSIMRVTVLLLLPTVLFITSCRSTSSSLPAWVGKTNSVVGTIDLFWGGQKIYLENRTESISEARSIASVLLNSRKASTQYWRGTFIEMELIGPEDQIAKIRYSRGYYKYRREVYRCGNGANLIADQMERPLLKELRRKTKELIEKHPELKSLPPPGA